MWVWVIGFVAVCTVLSVVIARRGPGNGTDHSADDARNDLMRGTPGFGGGGGLGGDGGAG